MWGILPEVNYKRTRGLLNDLWNNIRAYSYICTICFLLLTVSTKLVTNQFQKWSKLLWAIICLTYLLKPIDSLSGHRMSMLSHICDYHIYYPLPFHLAGKKVLNILFPKISCWLKIFLSAQRPIFYIDTMWIEWRNGRIWNTKCELRKQEHCTSRTD